MKVPLSGPNLPRSPRRAADEGLAQRLGYRLDPGRVAEREAAAERAADRLDLGVGLVGHDLASPRGAAGRLVAAKVGPFRGRGQQGVGEPLAVGRVARPAMVGRVGDHPGAEGIGLDVAEDGPEMGIVLDDGALEPPLPDVAGGAMAAVEVPGVGDGERLEDAADGDAGLGSEEEVEVVGHEAVGVEAERIAELGACEAVKEGVVVLVVGEDDLAVVAAIDGMVEEAVVMRSKCSSHEVRFSRGWGPDARGNLN